LLARYDDGLRDADDFVKYTYNMLKKRGLLKNTIFIVTSDHGEDLYIHGKPAHGGSLYNSEVHIPLFIYGPSIKPGVRYENVSLMDIAPTVIAAAGLPSHPSYSGTDLLSKKAIAPKRPLFLINDFISQGFASIIGSYKYIYSLSKQKEWLYNFKQDQYEQHNLAFEKKEMLQAFRWLMRQKIKSSSKLELKR